MTTTDLTICQECKENPAVYGDGLTWSRCGACELKHNKEIPTEQSPVEQKNNNFPHEVKKGLVSIILPVYMNSYTLFHYTGNCIGSIREHTTDPFELVVIDNGSPIKPPNLNSYYASRVIQNEANLGVTKAWNQGIRMSTGEYVVLLNNDVQVFNRWMETMKKALDEDGYDLVMAHPMYSLTEPFARAIESANIATKAILSGNKYSKFKDFSCVMFKRSLINELGVFDERFFSYCSDSDFIRRMEDAGKKWACCEHVPTSHISDATGFSMTETPEIMNKDKAAYKEKWENVQKESSGDMRLLIRFEGDAVYLFTRNLYHHISDPETLRALGFEFGQESQITRLKVLAQGEEINMQNYQKYV